VSGRMMRKRCGLDSEERFSIRGGGSGDSSMERRFRSATAAAIPGMYAGSLRWPRCD